MGNHIGGHEMIPTPDIIPWDAIGASLGLAAIVWLHKDKNVGIILSIAGAALLIISRWL